MKKNVIFSTIEVTIITLLIKFLGIIKQSVLAACCGANEKTDIFFIATGILVNLCVVVFSAISISLLTIHTQRLVTEGRESANKLINAVLRIAIPVSIIMSLLFFFGAPFFAKIFAPSYNQEQLQILSRYVRIMSVSFVLWCYYLTLNVVLETDKEFLPGKCQGLFQNVLLIFAAVLLYKRFGISSLIYSFLISGVLECALVTWCVRDRFKFIFGYIDEKEALSKLFEVSVPLILGSSIYEINDIVDKQISTGLGAGNASFLNYGATINEIVTGVIVTSVSTVLFSHFATWIAEKKVDKVEKSLEKTIEFLTVLIFPILVICLVAGDQIVEILYGRGSFGQKEIVATYGVVVGYALGFIFQAARANIVKVYYAFQDSKTPMINGLISVSINITLSVILSKYIGIMGVALATSIAMLIVTALLLKNIRRYLPEFSINKIIPECQKGIISAIVSFFALIGIKNSVNINLYIDFIVEVIVCGGVYLLIMVTLKSKSVHTAVSIFRGRGDN